MNTYNDEVNTERKKNGVIRTLAILGLIGLIIIIGWLGIKAVQLAPAAFNSLASLADSVYNNADRQRSSEFEIKTDKAVVNDRETFVATWNEPKQNGTFVFSYECTDGVSVDLRSNGEIRSLSCDTDYNLGDVNSVELNVKSEQNRFTDVAYTIAFLPEDAIETTYDKRSTITIVNAAISPIAVIDEEEEEIVEVPAEETPTTETPTTPTTPTTPAPTPRPTQPKYVTKYVYQIPVSNPNGYTDLSIKPLGVGYISGKTFVKTGSYRAGENGAIQFEVKNIGTKTSNTWKYTATLPGGQVYESPTQAALKPNERAVISIGFVAPSKTGTAPYNISVSISGDSNTSNNYLLSAVLVK